MVRKWYDVRLAHLVWNCQNTDLVHCLFLVHAFHCEMLVLLLSILARALPPPPLLSCVWCWSQGCSSDTAVEGRAWLLHYTMRWKMVHQEKCIYQVRCVNISSVVSVLWHRCALWVRVWMYCHVYIYKVVACKVAFRFLFQFLILKAITLWAMDVKMLVDVVKH